MISNINQMNKSAIRLYNIQNTSSPDNKVIHN